MSMCRKLTRLIVMQQEYKKRHQLIFGAPVLTREIGGPYCERHHFFEPGQLFGLELWEANEYGTVRWLLLVLKALVPGERGSLLPPLAPGAEVLLAAHGRKQVRRARLAELPRGLRRGSRHAFPRLLPGLAFQTEGPARSPRPPGAKRKGARPCQGVMGYRPAKVSARQPGICGLPL